MVHLFHERKYEDLEGDHDLTHWSELFLLLFFCINKKVVWRDERGRVQHHGEVS